MSISEQIAHLKGLAEGLDIAAENTKEAKLLSAMLDVIAELGKAVTEMEDNLDLVNEELDEISDEMMNFEEDFYTEDEDEDETFTEESDEYEDEDGVFYQVECPECGEQMTVDEDTLLEGSIRCEACGQLFSLEVVDGEDADEDEEDWDEGEE